MNTLKIPRQEMEQKLHEITLSTFEQLAFMFPILECDESVDNYTCDGTVHMGFNGPLNGTLVVRSYNGLMRALAANMLGDDLIPSDSAQHDALGEIANVIGGNMLPVITEPDHIITLCKPEWVPGDRAPDGEQVAAVWTVVDEGAVGVELYLAE